MRSILKFFGYVIFVVLIPSLILSLSHLIFKNQNFLFISQLIIMLIFTLSYLKLKKYEKAYEDKTLEFIQSTKNIEQLKDFRNKRITYRSKAEITKRIIELEYSSEELSKLKKYANLKEDMIFYYSSIISKDRTKREEFKNRRDNFNKRYGNKVKIYVNFNENLKISLRWMALFFILSAIAYTRFYSRFLSEESFFLVSILIFILNFIVMLMTMIWIIRTTKSYWTKDYI